MRYLLGKLGRTIAMLLIAVMVVVPVADAFGCAPEVPPGDSIEMVVDDHVSAQGESDETGDTERQNGGCAHNHCHHTTASIPANPAIIQDIFSKDILLASGDDDRLSNAYGGVMRPPRN